MPILKCPVCSWQVQTSYKPRLNQLHTIDGVNALDNHLERKHPEYCERLRKEIEAGRAKHERREDNTQEA